MGYIAGLVPGTKAASTCQVNAQGIHLPHPRCGSGPIISITSEEDRRLSLGLRRKESSEPRVNFSLPPKASTSQTSSREKIRGSPRFPHRIVPANSLNAIACGVSISRSPRWHSMEDARKSKLSLRPRDTDVWATRGLGIPLSELGNSVVRGNRVPETLTLTSTTESNMNSVEIKVSSDRKTTFEADGEDSSAKFEVIRSSSSSSSSSSNNARTTSAANEALTVCKSECNSQSDRSIQDAESSRPLSPVTNSIVLENVSAEDES